MRIAKPLAILAVLTAFAGTAQAADLLIVDPAIAEEAAAFSWDGAYVGALVGGARITDFGYLNLGAVAGVNFEVTPGIIAGAEVEATAYFRDGGYIGTEGSLVGRLGATVSDELMVYGAAGVARLTDENTTFYKVAAGLEYAATESISLRGEVSGVGEFGDKPLIYRATVGALYHFN